MDGRSEGSRQGVLHSTLTGIYNYLAPAITGGFQQTIALTDQEKGDLGSWYKEGSQQKEIQPNNGLITYPDNDASNSGEITNGDIATSQSGSRPTEVAIEAQVE